MNKSSRKGNFSVPDISPTSHQSHNLWLCSSVLSIIVSRHDRGLIHNVRNSHILLIIFALKLIEDRAFLFRANFPNESSDVVQKMKLLFRFGDKLPHVRLICLAEISQHLQWRLNAENLIQSSSGIPHYWTKYHLRAPAEGQ